MTHWRYVQAVLWSFVGLGRREDMDALDTSAKPVVLIAVGIACAAMFIAVLLGLATLAVSLLTPVS
jgi:hypothetical protein